MAKDVRLLSCVGLFQWSTTTSCQLSSLNELVKVEVEITIGHLKVFFAYIVVRKRVSSQKFFLCSIFKMYKQSICNYLAKHILFDHWENYYPLNGGKHLGPFHWFIPTDYPPLPTQLLLPLALLKRLRPLVWLTTGHLHKELMSFMNHDALIPGRPNHQSLIDMPCVIHTWQLW